MNFFNEKKKKNGNLKYYKLHHEKTPEYFCFKVNKNFYNQRVNRRINGQFKRVNKSKYNKYYNTNWIWLALAWGHARDKSHGCSGHHMFCEL